MTCQIAICDDDQDALEKLSQLVAAWGAQQGHSCGIRTFPTAESFLFAWEDDQAYDVLLLDVEMPGLSGLNLARRLRREGCRAEIIFITSHFEFVTEGYDVDALHYLTKPVRAEKLMEVLTRAAEKRASAPPSVVISAAGETVRLYEAEILWVEASLHYITIHTRTQDHRVKETISAFEARLSDGFCRIHRSYLVGLRHVTRISRTAVYVGEEELPLARGKYDEVNLAFIRYN